MEFPQIPQLISIDGDPDAPMCVDGVCAPAPESAPTPLRCAIVGYGSSGRGIHARLIRAIGGEVVAVVARSEQTQSVARQDWPQARVVGSVEELLADPAGAEVIVLATPSGDHAQQAQALLAAGIPLIVDKPLGVDTQEAESVVEAARAASTPLTVFQNRRWDPEQLTATQVLASGELGTVHTFERHWERFRPVPRQRWKEQDVHGGGLLLDLGPHLVDSAVQLFGPVVAVSAELRRLTTPAIDDVFLVLHHAPTGPEATPVVSRLWASSIVGAPGPRTRILGTQAAYLVTSYEADASPFELLDADAPAGSLGWIARGAELTAVAQAPGGHEDFYRAVTQWVRTGGPAPVDPADAVRTAKILDAAVVADRERRTVEV